MLIMHGAWKTFRASFLWLLKWIDKVDLKTWVYVLLAIIILILNSIWWKSCQNLQIAELTPPIETQDPGKDIYGQYESDYNKLKHETAKVLEEHAFQRENYRINVNRIKRIEDEELRKQALIDLVGSL